MALATSVFRKSSVVKRLHGMVMLQTVVIILLYSFAAFHAVRQMTNNVQMTAQKILTANNIAMEEVLSQISVITKYPVILNSYGNSLFFDYLEDDQQDMMKTLNYHRRLEAQFSSIMAMYQKLDQIGVLNMAGMVFFTLASDSDYHQATIDWTKDILVRIQEQRGREIIITAEQMASLFPDFYQQGPCVYGARAIMQLNHLRPVGAIFCRLNFSGIQQAFYTDRTYEEQTMCVVDANGEVLLGQIDAELLAGLQPDQPNEKVTRWFVNQGGSALYQASMSTSGVMTILRTPVVCFLRDLSSRLVWLLAIFAMVVISLLYISRLMVRSICTPVNKLMEMCDKLSAEQFEVVEDDGAQDEMHSLIESFNQMSLRIQALIQEVYQKNLMQAQTEMQLLRSQINPHLVYNTLETMRSEAFEHGQKDLAEMAVLLSKSLRYGVSNPAETVRVSQELTHLKDYVQLQQYHFHGRLSVQINVEPEIMGYHVIKMILQPIVENAIYHGLSHTGRQECIRVLGYEEDDNLVFTVSDNGQGISSEKLAVLQAYVRGENDEFQSIGLRNTYRRIQLSYGKDYNLAIRSVLGKGTVITLRLPCRRSKAL